MPLNTLAVYCGSSLGNRPCYVEAASQLGTLMALREVKLVYGGGDVGLMGAVSRAVLAAGGQATGVVPTRPRSPDIPESLRANTILVDTIHDRKAMISEMADAFVALPGGSGTLEELAEQWTWAQLGMHTKPCGILNVEGFFDPFLDQVAAMNERGFTRGRALEMLVVSSDAEDLLDRLGRYEVPDIHRTKGRNSESKVDDIQE